MRLDVWRTTHTGKIDPNTLLHLEGKEENGKGRINYTVWSDVFICPFCGPRDRFLGGGGGQGKTAPCSRIFPVPNCQGKNAKKTPANAPCTFFSDSAINPTVTQAKQVPVLINYSWNKKRYEKTPDAGDLALIDKIEESEIPHWFPTDKMPLGYNSSSTPKISWHHSCASFLYKEEFVGFGVYFRCFSQQFFCSKKNVAVYF